MPNALRGIVILGVLSVLDAVVFVPVIATAQAAKPTNKVACCFCENGEPECGQLTTDNCAKHNGDPSLGAVSCAHNPCIAKNPCLASTTTTTAAPTTTTGAPVTTSSTSTSTSTPGSTSKIGRAHV